MEYRGKTLEEWKEYIKKDGDIPIRTQKYIIVLEELINELITKKTSDTFTVISISGYEGPSYDKQIIHIIEDEFGNQEKAKLRNLCDTHLSTLQPILSDEEPGYEETWGEYEEYQSKYLIGKTIKKNTIDGYITFELI